MPTRSYPDSIVTSTTTTNVQQNGQNVPGSPSTVSSTVKWTNSVTFGDNIPGWRDNLRRGLDATTSMVGSESFAHLNDGLLVCTRKYNPAFPGQIRITRVAGALNINSALPAGNPSTIDTTSADAKALARFGQRIVDINTAIQGGVVVGELAQTLRTIKNPLRGLRRSMDDVYRKMREVRTAFRRFPPRTVGQAAQQMRRRFSPSDFRKLKENLADQWLELQFGWRPLANDVAAGFNTLHNYNIGQAGLANRHVSASAKTEVASETSAVELSSIAVWKNVEISMTRASVKYRGAMRVEARDPKQMDAELLGLNPGAWLPTAWELMPYSFLIDYFSNAGEVIEGWSHLFTRLAWCNRTVRQEFEKTTSSWSNLTLVRKTTPDAESVSLTPPRYVCRKKSVSRAKYTGTLVPGLEFEIPGWDNLKWLNIVALVANRKADRSWSYD